MDKPIIALDFASAKEVDQFLDRFDPKEVLFVKVGMELYYACGPSIITSIKSRGHAIFLDLKLHDIPNTVESAMRTLAKLCIDMVNVHAAGGSKMIQAAKKGLTEGTLEGHSVPKLIAVTQLTSINDDTMRKEQLIPVSLLESVVHLCPFGHGCRSRRGRLFAAGSPSRGSSNPAEISASDPGHTSKQC